MKIIDFLCIFVIVDFVYCSFDIFAAHGRWNGSEVRRLIPDGYSLTILRNPVEAFESYYSYMSIDTKLHMDINEFAMALAIRNVSECFSH